MPPVTRRRPGPRPSTRKPLHLDFLRAIQTSAIPNYRLAMLAGFRHEQQFSRLLHAADGAPVSARPELLRLAEFLGYPAAQIFADEVEEVAAS